MTSQSTTFGQSSHNQNKTQLCSNKTFQKQATFRFGLAYPGPSTPSLDEILKKQKVNPSFETIPPPHIG